MYDGTAPSEDKSKTKGQHTKGHGPGREVWQHAQNEAKETADIGTQHTVRNNPLTTEDGKRYASYVS